MMLSPTNLDEPLLLGLQFFRTLKEKVKDSYSLKMVQGSKYNVCL